MLKSGTHFEQVPLETVRKIIKEQLQREARTGEDVEEVAEERPETAFAAVEEPSMAELATFLARSDRNDS
jgi:hypothetical protein